jgi:hypothetical protein
MQAIDQHIQLLFWLSLAAIIIALGAWLPWITTIINSNRKDLGQQNAEKLPDSGTSQKKRKLARIAAVCRWAWNGFRAFFKPAGSEPRIRRRLTWGTIAGISLLLLLLAKTLFSAFSPLPGAWIADLAGVKTGLNASRFANVDWQAPSQHKRRIAELDLCKSDSSLLSGDFFSYIFDGYLYVEKSGIYEIILTSDDGSTLELDGQKRISNPGYHSAREASDQLHLDEGFHPLTVKYFNGTSDAVIRLEWIVPGGVRHNIPASNLFLIIPSDAQCRSFTLLQKAFSGLNWALLIAGAFLILRKRKWRIPSFALQNASSREQPGGLKSGSGLKSAIPSILLSLFLAGLLFGSFAAFYYLPADSPVPHGLSGKLYETGEFNVARSSFDGRRVRFNSVTDHVFRQQQFGAIFTGFIDIPESGPYTFSLAADNGARMFLDSQQLIDGWKGNSRYAAIGSRNLDEGFHAVRIEMYNDLSPAYIDWNWQPPKTTGFRPIPFRNLYKTAPTQIIYEKDLRFQFMRSAAIFSALIIAILIFVWLSLFRHTKVFPSLSIPLSLALFLDAFLLQIAWMEIDYRYGFNWFARQNALAKSIVLLIPLLLAMPAVRDSIRRLPRWIAVHPSLQRLLFFIALLSGIIGQKYFTGPGQIEPNLGVTLFAVSALCVLLNMSMSKEGSEPAAGERAGGTASVRWTAFLLILLAAAFVRFYRLQEMPPGLWWDEAQTGIVARDILRGDLPPVYDLRINAGTAASYLLAGWFYTFGSSVYAMRAYTATIGIITTAVSYPFFRQFFAPWRSLFGMAIIAVSRWLFSINRVTMATIDETILLAFLVFIFYIRAIKHRRYRDYILTGILLGLGLHLHTGARVLPPIIAIDIVVRLIKDKSAFLKSHLRPALCMIIAACVVFMPMFMYILDRNDEYFKRSKQTLLSNEYPGWYPVPPLLDNVVNYLKMYSFSGDWHPRHNYAQTPQLPPLISILALWGLIYSFKKLGGRHATIFYLGFILISLQGILTVHNNTANLNRVAENIPIVYLWAVAGALYLSDGTGLVFQRKTARIVSLVSMLAILVFSSANAYRIYFEEYIYDSSLMGDFGFQPELTEPAQYISRLLKENSSITVWASYTQTDSFRYILIGDQRLHEINGETLPQLPEDKPEALVLLAQDEKLTSLAKERYPDARIEEVPYSLDSSRLLFRVFFINESASKPF